MLSTSNKTVVFALFAGCGGVVGSLCAEAPNALWSPGIGAVLMCLDVALWAAVATAGVSVALFWADRFYNRRPGMPWAVAKRALLAGAMAGSVAGGLAQALFLVELDSWAIKHYVLRPVCWGLCGSVLGARLAAVVPNLGIWRAIVGAGLGGTIGGYGFVFSSFLLPDVVGRLVGWGLLGAGLGCSVVLMEQLTRKAFVEVEWARNEKTSMTLGPEPIRIGGGEDNICVKGLKAHAADILLDGGRVCFVDRTSGNTSILRNGSRIQIGGVAIRVHVCD